jgi:hypothetical protein
VCFLFIFISLHHEYTEDPHKQIGLLRVGWGALKINKGEKQQPALEWQRAIAQRNSKRRNK